MNKVKLYKECKNKTCAICNRDVDMKDIVENNVEISITKRETIILVHKNCLGRR